MLFPILPSALPLYIIEPVDAELEAAIEAVEVPPMATAIAVPVVAISPCTHNSLNSLNSWFFLGSVGFAIRHVRVSRICNPSQHNIYGNNPRTEGF